MRHGNAVPARRKGRAADLARPLSMIGRAQIHRRAEMLASLTGMWTDDFCSSAERAVQTAQSILKEDDRSWVNIVPELFTPEGPDGEIHDKLFAELKYAPAAAYLAHPLNLAHERDGDGGPFGRFSTNTGTLLAGRIVPHKDNEHFATALIIGQAVLTPLTVKGIVIAKSGPNEALSDFLDNLEMVEAGAFRVTFAIGTHVDTTFELYD